MKRVIVIGCPGSGKSTFSRKLQTVSHLPLYHLDLLYWKPDHTIVPKEKFLEELRRIMKQEQWILDGNYSSTMELRMQACDTVIFLDYPTELCLAGAEERKGKKRPDLPWIEAENESDEEFMELIRNYNRTNRPLVMDLLAKYSDKNITVFRNRKEADEFIKQQKISRS